jgi:transcriptional regulator of acetoin/glycerol metabolism
LYRQYNREKLRAARHNFEMGLPVEPDSVRSIILESWHRCRQFRLDPKCGSQYVLPPEETKNRLEQYHALLKAAYDYLVYLYEDILQREGMVLLSDVEGVILFSAGNAGTYEAPKVGTDWSEKAIGTNGVGTCVYLRQPIQIFAEEHFRYIRHALYCSGAPIYGPTGHLLGCLNVTGTSENVHTHTLGMVISLAKAIEKQIRVNQITEENQKIIRQQSEILNFITDAVIIINQAGNVTHINDQGLRFFAITEKDILNQPIKNLIPDIDLQTFFVSQVMVYDMEINLSLPRKNLSCRVSSAITRDNLGNPESLILTFKNSKKINYLVNKITGSVARYSFDKMIGDSTAFQKVKHQGLIAASTNANVLITGESGTGKDLMAQAIHQASSRAHMPFVPINCGALPRGLVESELFGYEGGSFTGSKKEGNPGKFELADGGTIFLDEIGEMPLEVQVTLLRVIEDKLVTRIGGTKSKQIDVRIIAATNKNLEAEVFNKNFREDLYYRLNVFTINMPPLRKRGEDLELLIDNILHRLRKQTGKSDLSIDEQARQALTNYHWPGNIRELENILERAASVCEGSIITYQELPAVIFPEGNLSPEKIPMIKQTEMSLILEVLSATNGNIKQTAERLGVARSTIYRKLKQAGIPLELTKTKM